MIFLFNLEYSTLYAVILIWETLKKFIASLPVLSFFYFHSLLAISEIKCEKTKFKLTEI